MDKYSFLNAAHTAYFADLYEQYQQDPDSVELSWKAFFQGYDFGSESFEVSEDIVEGVKTQIPEHVQKEFQVIKLIDDYRTRGHLFTKTNPVRDRRKYTPSLVVQGELTKFAIYNKQYMRNKWPTKYRGLWLGAVLNNS